jgi:uncharacterized protein (TIGR02145 family)
MKKITCVFGMTLMVLLFIAAGSSEPQTSTVLDIDGNVYTTVKIGDQWWMTENLRVTKNRSGHPIRTYCYNDDESYCEKYGRLYTWDVIAPEPDGEHDMGITPPGWHIPSEAEWEELVKTLGGEEKVAEMIRVGGSSGFNAHLSGGSDFKGDYLNLDKSAMFWSSTVVNEDQVYRMGINDKGKWVKSPAFKEARLHSRCVKDKN